MLGYHIYQDIWNSHVGETLSCVRERGNTNDIFAVAVQKDAKAVGHVPRHISCSCNLFICRGGLLSCSVTGTRQYSSDLPQGGLEVPCYYMFSGIKDLIVKARDRLEELKVKVLAIKENTAVTIMLWLNPLNILKTYDVGGTTEPLQTSENVWVKIKDISLKYSDRDTIEKGLQLSDLHINSA